MTDLWSSIAPDHETPLKLFLHGLFPAMMHTMDLPVDQALPVSCVCQRVCRGDPFTTFFYLGSKETPHHSKEVTLEEVHNSSIVVCAACLMHPSSGLGLHPWTYTKDTSDKEDDLERMEWTVKLGGPLQPLTRFFPTRTMRIRLVWDVPDAVPDAGGAGLCPDPSKDDGSSCSLSSSYVSPTPPPVKMTLKQNGSGQSPAPPASGTRKRGPSPLLLPKRKRPRGLRRKRVQAPGRETVHAVVPMLSPPPSSARALSSSTTMSPPATPPPSLGVSPGPNPTLCEKILAEESPDIVLGDKDDSNDPFGWESLTQHVFRVHASPPPPTRPDVRLHLSETPPPAPL